MSRCFDTNLQSYVFLILLIFLTCVYTGPLVLDNAPSCSYHIKPETYYFTNKMWSTSKGTVTVYFNLCSKLPSNICGQNVMACVKHDNSTVLLKDFRVDSALGEPVKELFKLVTENKVDKAITTTLEVGITNRCLDLGDELKMKMNEILGPIVYHVYMNYQTCSCTVRIKDKHLDLRSMKGTYSVQSPSKNFSISLCEPNKQCGTNITACIMENNRTEPLSDVNKEILGYEEGENQVVLKGKYHKTDTNHNFEIRLQCNWNMKKPKISYIVPEHQGKTYRFLAESLQGCIIKNPQCEFPSSSYATYYYHNLSRLNNEEGYMVRNMSVGSQMYINPCGRLRFKGEKNFCTDTYSQICEIRNNKYFNKGSILKSYESHSDHLLTTYASGITCKDNDTKQYQTHISFRCSQLEKNPTVVNSDECDLYIEWKTREACLKAKKDECEEIPNPLPYNCAIEYDGDVYSLSKLAKENSSYVVKDKDDPSIEYLLNVCTSVVDDEAVCIKGASVILKNSTELDIRNRVKLLGKINSLSMVDDQLIIEASNGHQCNSTEYSSKIRFVCANREEVPVLSNKTKCSFEFVFKTKYACANQTVPGKNAKCRFKYSSKDSQNHFQNLKPNMLEVLPKNANTSYYFNICKTELPTKCSNGECVYVQPEKWLYVYQGKKYLDFQLNRTCQTPDEFNRTLIELVCEPGVKNNDHFGKLNITNCILYIPLVTSYDCSNDQNIVYQQSEGEKIKQSEYLTGDIDIYGNLTKFEANEFDVDVNRANFSGEKKLSIGNQDCTSIIHNNYTGYTFSITSLNLKVKAVGCPSVAFNYSGNFVSIVYSTHNQCFNVSYGKNLNEGYSGCERRRCGVWPESVSCMPFYFNYVKSPGHKYNVVLKCVPDGPYKIVKNSCEETIINLPEACKLLEEVPLKVSYSKATVAGIALAVIAILATIVTASVLVYLKLLRRRTSYDTILYEKDGDL